MIYPGVMAGDFPRPGDFFRARRVKKGPENPISVIVSGESGGTRDQPPCHTLTTPRACPAAHPGPARHRARRPRAGGTGPGVPLSIWPGLPAPRSGPHGPCAGPVTAAAAAQVIGAFSRPGDLVAAPDGSAAVIEAAAAAGPSSA